MLRVALTGGIATGKSHCLARFAALGVPVIDADVLARDVVAPGTPGLDAIVSRFGESVLEPSGELNRPALAAIVFSDPMARADLEAIIHPEVYRRINVWFADQPGGTPMAMADIPLLFETGHEYEFDAVVVAACDPSEQIRRLSTRDGLGIEAARARLAAQWPIDEKVNRADYVVQTDTSFSDTDDQVRAVYRALLEAS